MARKGDLLSQDTAVFFRGDELYIRKSAKIFIGTDPRLEAHGKSKRLGRKAIGIGRDRTNGVIIADERVSKFHAVLTLYRGDAFFKDTGSTNGTTINGKKLVPKRSYRLKSGDVIVLGRTRLTVHT